MLSWFRTQADVLRSFRSPGRGRRRHQTGQRSQRHQPVEPRRNPRGHGREPRRLPV